MGFLPNKITDSCLKCRASVTGGGRYLILARTNCFDKVEPE